MANSPFTPRPTYAVLQRELSDAHSLTYRSAAPRLSSPTSGKRTRHRVSPSCWHHPQRCSNRAPDRASKPASGRLRPPPSSSYIRVHPVFTRPLIPSQPVLAASPPSRCDEVQAPRRSFLPKASSMSARLSWFPLALQRTWRPPPGPRIRRFSSRAIRTPPISLHDHNNPWPTHSSKPPARRPRVTVSCRTFFSTWRRSLSSAPTPSKRVRNRYITSSSLSFPPHRCNAPSAWWRPSSAESPSSIRATSFPSRTRWTTARPGTSRASSLTTVPNVISVVASFPCGTTTPHAYITPYLPCFASGGLSSYPTPL